MTAIEKKLKAALDKIICAANAHSEPIHYVVRDAISAARESLCDVAEIEEANRKFLEGRKVPVTKHPR